MSIRIVMVAAWALMLMAPAAADGQVPVLRKPPGPGGCLGPDPGCSNELHGLGVRVWVASPNGRVVFGVAHRHEVDESMYTSAGRDIVVPFQRAPDGRLHPPGGGCAQGRGPCVRLAPAEQILAMRLTPDGRTLVAMTPRRLLVFHPGARGRLGRPRFAASSPGGGWSGLALTADGRWVYATFASLGGGGIVGFALDPVSGGVRRLPGSDGCLRTAAAAVSPTYASCGLLPDLTDVQAVAVSSDASLLDVAGATVDPKARPGAPLEVLALRRDQGTGRVRPVGGAGACVATKGIARCRRLPGTSDFVTELLTAPRRVLYFGWDAGGVFLRQDLDGSFDQPPASSGCPPSGRCLSFGEARAVALGPSGRVFAASEFELEVLRSRVDGTIFAGRGRTRCLVSIGAEDCFPLPIATTENGGANSFGAPVPIPGHPERVELNATGDVLELGPPASRPPRGVRRLAFVAPANEGIWSVAADGRDDLRLLAVTRCSDERLTRPSFDARGDVVYALWLASCATPAGGIVLRPPRGRPRFVKPVPRTAPFEALGPSLDPSGRLLAYDRSGRRDVVWLRDLRTGHERRVALGTEPALGRGRRLVWTGSHGLEIGGVRARPRALTRAGRCRSPDPRLPGCEVADSQPAWTPAGTVVFTRFLTYFDPKCRGDESCSPDVQATDLWEIRPGHRPRRLTRLGDVQEPAVSPSGALAYVRSGTIWVRRLHGGRARAVADGFQPAWLPR